MFFRRSRLGLVAGCFVGGSRSDSQQASQEHGLLLIVVRLRTPLLLSAVLLWLPILLSAVVASLCPHAGRFLESARLFNPDLVTPAQPSAAVEERAASTMHTLRRLVDASGQYPGRTVANAAAVKRRAGGRPLAAKHSNGQEGGGSGSVLGSPVLVVDGEEGDGEGGGVGSGLGSGAVAGGGQRSAKECVPAPVPDAEEAAAAWMGPGTAPAPPPAASHRKSALSGGPKGGASHKRRKTVVIVAPGEEFGGLPLPDQPEQAAEEGGAPEIAAAGHASAAAMPTAVVPVLALVPVEDPDGARDAGTYSARARTCTHTHTRMRTRTRSQCTHWRACLQRAHYAAYMCGHSLCSCCWDPDGRLITARAAQNGGFSSAEGYL